MIKTTAFVGLGLCILVLTGCAPKIDGSSAKASIPTRSFSLDNLNEAVREMEKIRQDDMSRVYKKHMLAQRAKLVLETGPKGNKYIRSNVYDLIPSKRTGTDYSSSQSFTTPESWTKVSEDALSSIKSLKELLKMCLQVSTN